MPDDPAATWLVVVGLASLSAATSYLRPFPLPPVCPKAVESRRRLPATGRCHCHGPWCHGGYGYPPPGYGVPPTGSRLRAPPATPGAPGPDEEDHEEYLAELEAEIATVRRDLGARR